MISPSASAPAAASFSNANKISTQSHKVGSASPEAGQDGADGADGDEGVHDEGQALHVVEVVGELYRRLVGAGGVALGDLGPAGDAGPDDVAQAEVGDRFLELLDELDLLRPRADEAHVPFEDVDELGQLVDAELADECADAGHPGVPLGGEGGAVLLRVVPHAPDLVDREGLSAHPDALLGEDGRPRALQLHGDHREEEKRHPERHGEQHHEDVHDALEDHVEGGLLEVDALGRVEVVQDDGARLGFDEVVGGDDRNALHDAAAHELYPLLGEFAAEVHHHPVHALRELGGRVNRDQLHVGVLLVLQGIPSPHDRQDVEGEAGPEEGLSAEPEVGEDDVEGQEPQGEVHPCRGQGHEEDGRGHRDGEVDDEGFVGVGQGSQACQDHRHDQVGSRRARQERRDALLEAVFLYEGEPVEGGVGEEREARGAPRQREKNGIPMLAQLLFHGYSYRISKITIVNTRRQRSLHSATIFSQRSIQGNNKVVHELNNFTPENLEDRSK